MHFWQSCFSLGQSWVVGHRLGFTSAVPQFCRTWEGFLVRFPITPPLWPSENRLAKLMNLGPDPAHQPHNISVQSRKKLYDTVRHGTAGKELQPFLLIPVTSDAVHQGFLSNTLGWGRIKPCWPTSAYLLDTLLYFRVEKWRRALHKPRTKSL